MARPPKAQDVHEGRGPTGETLGSHALIIVNEDGKVASFTPSAIATQLLYPAPAYTPCSIEFLQPAIRELITSFQHSQRPIVGQRIQWQSASGATVVAEAHLLPWMTDRKAKDSNALPVAISVSLLEGPFQAGGAVPETALRPWFASVAHEIKNSLVPLKTFVDLLLEREPEHEMADLIRREVQRISRAVGQMLWTAAPSQSRFGWVPVTEMVELVLQRVRPQAQKRSIRLTSHFQSGDMRIWGDSNQIEQALLNLLINGFEAVGDGGEVTVSTQLRESEVLRQGSRSGNIAGTVPSGRCLVIRVRDNGSGISAEHFPRLFQQHFTTKPQGTGLGLSIAQQIMKSHDGSIEVSSEVNQGTTFDLVFPLLDKAPEVRA